MKALFCTDGSEISFYALTNLSSFNTNITIDILCVIDWHFYPMYMSYPEPDYSNTYEEIATNILALAKEEIKQRGFTVGDLELAWGGASEEIIKYSENKKYDIIIMGSHGKKGIKSWLGSASRKVVNKTKTPIFISKESKKNEIVLLTADGSQGSRNAIKKAISLFDLSNKDIYVITVMEDISNLPLEITSNKQWLNDYIKKRNCATENILKDTKAILKEHNLSIKKDFTLIGAPSSTIIQTAEEEKVDLIVLGSHSKDKFSEFLLGSTSKRVLDNTKSSVLIVSPDIDD